MLAGLKDHGAPHTLLLHEYIDLNRILIRILRILATHDHNSLLNAILATTRVHVLAIHDHIRLSPYWASDHERRPRRGAPLARV